MLALLLHGYKIKRTMKKIRDLITGFINNNDSTKNSKLIVALFFSLTLALSGLLVMIGVPPIESTHVATIIWGQVTVILGALGVNGYESIRKS